MNKYLFIDESGDPGLDIDGGASKYFVMVAIVFDDVLEMETVSLEIKKLSRKLFNNDYHEFHFVHEKNNHRSEFLKLISVFNYKILVNIVDKTKDNIQGNIYKYSLKQISAKLENERSTYSFKFDGKVSKSYKLAVEKELRALSRGKFSISKIKFSDSKSDSLIQMADMCAGVIRRCHEKNKPGVNEQYVLIKDKII